MPNPLFIMPQPSENQGTGRTPMSRADAARHAALVRWKKEQPLAPQTGGMANPKIRARVAEILAAKRKGKAKAKAKPKGRKGPDPAKAKAKAEREKEAAAKKQEREKAKAERERMAAGRASQREQRKIEIATNKAERAKAAIAKQQAQQKKLKQAAAAKKEKAKATQAKQAATAAQKEANSPEKKQAANRAKVAAEIASNEAGLSKRGTTALNDFADGKPLDPGTADDFEAMGIVEKDEQGNHRLTTEGNAVARAMSKGDTRATLDAISRAASKKKSSGDKAKASAVRTSERDKAKSDATAKREKAEADKRASAAKVEAARIEAARNRKAMNDFDELAIKAGARHSRTDMQHLQGIHDSAVACGASCAPSDDEAPDDEMEMDEAGKAIKGIMDNPQWYAQHECGDIMQAANALSTMAMLIQSELVEEDEDDAHITLLCDGARVLVKFISAELDELEGAAGDAADNARMGPMKAIDDDWLHIEGDAIKAIDDETVRGYVVLFGDKEHSDLQRDYFTKATDFWLDHFGWPRPITYHHGMDAATRDDPIIGHWMKAGVDNVGLWLEGQLDRAHAYYKAMRELARRGYLKPSTDSAPQWVLREKQDNGTNFVKRWPMISSSLTVTPMEPRMLPVEVKALMAEIGLEAIDDSQEAINPDAARLDEAKAADDERARLLTLELDLLELETAV